MQHLLHERAITLGFTIDNSSFHTYSSTLRSYIQFCDAHTIPIDPTPDTLSLFAMYMSAHIKPSSINSYLSSIC